MKKLVLLISLLFVLTLHFPASTMAGGENRVGGVSPEAGAMSGAYIGVAQGIPAFYYNPAGLTQTNGLYTFLGADILFPQFEYKVNGITFKSDDDACHILPLAGLIYKFSERAAFGIGITVPYGLGAKFPQRPEYGFSATESLFTLTDISPTIAIKITDKLSLGASLNIGWSEFVYKAPLVLGGMNIGVSDSDADGWGLGATIGLLWKPSERFSWGAVYRTETRVKLSGATSFNTVFGASADDFDAHFTFPGRLGTGIAIRPLNDLVIAIDANWYDYSGASVMDINYANSPSQRQTLGWDDNYSLHLGAEYTLGNWALRAGAGYQTAVVPDETISPLTPDVTGWDISAGIGYRWKNLAIDLAYIFNWGERTVNASPNNMAPGEYSAEIGIFSFGISYMF